MEHASEVIYQLNPVSFRYNEVLKEHRKNEQQESRIADQEAKLRARNSKLKR